MVDVVADAIGGESGSMQDTDGLRDVGGLRGFEEDVEEVGDDALVAQGDENDGLAGVARPLDAFDQGVWEAAGGLELSGLNAVRAANLPPGMLEIGEEASGVLDVESAAVYSY
jgi:hypothetical protein